MSETTSFPAPQEQDSNEVRWALETAQNLWSTDPRESLRWLRRAAESAADSGDDLRSVHLARIAADLRAEANIQGSLPPAASSPPPPGAITTAFVPSQPQVVVTKPMAVLPITAAPAAQVAADAESPDAVPTSLDTPAAQAQGQRITPMPEVVAAAPASTPAAPISGSPRHSGHEKDSDPSPAVAPPSLDLQPSASPENTAETTSAPRAVESVATPARQERAIEVIHPTPAESPASIASAKSGIRVDAPAENSQRGKQHQAVRVAVSRAPAGNGLYQLHRLTEGEALPPGWTEALIVGVAPGTIFDR